VKVGIIIYGNLNIKSGGFIYDKNIVKYLVDRGDQVEVISLSWRPYALSLLDNLDFRLKRRLKDAPFDVLIQDELVHPSCFGLNQQLRLQITYPIVAIVHHLRCRERHSAWLNQVYREVEKRYLASVDGFVCVSRTTKGDVEDLVGTDRPTVVAPPGGDRLPGQIATEQIVDRALEPGPLKIICVANLIPRKGIHTLIRALSNLPHNGWQLTIAGNLGMDENYVNRIRHQIKQENLNSKILFLGTISDKKLAVLLPEQHLLAVPSSYEGFGIVYLEGMHFGLPAIASTAGAARELIRHEDNGFLVPPGDAASLTRYISLLMEDRELLKRLSLAAHRSVAAHPTWNESAAKIRGFLQSFLG
jgi:glycosyltransferase involved in cell wall biosynthesis